MSITKEKIEFLHENWLEACKILHICRDVESQYQFMVYMYTDPRRHYHNIDHIYQCLEQVEKFDESESNRAVINMALWFHDLVYNVATSDSEEISAQLAYDFLFRNGSVHCFLVKTAIEYTNHKYYEPFTLTCRSEIKKVYSIILDIDLSILAADHADYINSSNRIFNEYEEVYSAHDLLIGRKQFLEKMLRRKIYLTPLYQDLFEKKAQNNLSKELASIQAVL